MLPRRAVLCRYMPPVKYSIAVENAAKLAQPKHIALAPPAHNTARQDQPWQGCWVFKEMRDKVYRGTPDGNPPAAQACAPVTSL